MNIFDSQNKDDIARFQNFIVFEPASVRVIENDVLFQGVEVKAFYDDCLAKFSGRKLSLKEEIVFNRLSKIGHMLNLLENPENIILTKFFDRVWRRYSYISHLGENFMALDTFVDLFPDFSSKIDETKANRFEGIRKDLEDMDSDMGSEDTDSESEEADSDSADAHENLKESA